MPHPRRNGPRRTHAPGGEPRRPDAVEQASDGDWVVRPITGASSSKTYRCPGCDHEIRPATPHVVTWPAYARDSAADDRNTEAWDTDSAADWRRHWHTTCWRARDRRR